MCADFQRGPTVMGRGAVAGSRDEDAEAARAPRPAIRAPRRPVVGAQ